jgi:hypothetical protein
MMNKLFQVVLVGCVAMLITGCGGGSKAKTPVEAATKVQDAFASGDREGFVACFEGTDSQKEDVGQAFDAGQAFDGFETKVIEVFGEEGMAELLADLPGGGQGLADRMDIFNYIRTADLSALAFTESEDGATAVGAAPSGETFDFIKADGGWKLPMPELPSGPMGMSAADMMEMMTPLFEEMTGEVGKEGMTIEKLKETFFTHMMDTMAKRMEDSGMMPPGGPGGYMP